MKGEIRVPRFVADNQAVLYFAYVTLLTPAQGRLRAGLVPAQDLLRLAYLCSG
jgi:hypothetical protein